MADTTILSAKEMRELANEVHAQAEAMRIKSDRTLKIYVIVGILLVGYLFWAFHRIVNFIEPSSLAQNTGEIALGKARDLIADGESLAKSKAPELIREAENNVIHAVPEFRATLETKLRTEIAHYVKVALEEGDQVLVEELAKIPDAPQLMAAAPKDPDAAAKLYGEVRKAIMARKDVKSSLAETMTELNKLRDRLRKIKDNHNLTPSERAERHLLQLVLAKVDLGKEPLTATVAVAPPAAKDAKEGKPTGTPLECARPVGLEDSSAAPQRMLSSSRPGESSSAWL